MEFENGSQICADAVVLSGQVTVNESLLTGETDAIPKLTGDALKSGSFISCLLYTSSGKRQNRNSCKKRRYSDQSGKNKRGPGTEK